MNIEISVIIPCLNAQSSLPACLKSLETALNSDLIKELILVDGGSNDQSIDIAKKFGCRVISTAKGRGNQLKKGAESASGNWLLFLHSDSFLQNGWEKEIPPLFKKNNQHKAYYFRFSFVEENPISKLWRYGVYLRCRLFSLPYGDQALLLPKSLYEITGGYSDLPLMEDVEFIQRIKKQSRFTSLIMLQSYCYTSSIRYQKQGFFRRTLKNWFCLWLYYRGRDVREILHRYDS